MKQSKGKIPTLFHFLSMSALYGEDKALTVVLRKQQRRKQCNHNPIMDSSASSGKI